MGIPGLTTRLEPYAIRCKPAELEGYVAIIDGPALAYAAHRSAAEANKSLPSYADINAVAIRWLKHLESVNIKVSAILFDGALPASKTDERTSRLLQMARRVVQLKAMYNGTACPILSSLGSVAYALLAPALMEALNSSDFAQVTRIVPGEADDWCAFYARDSARSIIFTGDSDLLLYDYPPEVLVNFLKGVDIAPDAPLIVYSPTKIGQQLKLDSLVHLAYAMHNDRWKSLAENAQDARDIDLKSAPYVEFSTRYIDKPQSPLDLSNCTELDASLQTLDVRVSEFVLRALSIRLAPTDEPPLAISVFLPLLVEDPFQASAWNYGQDVRLVSYSLFMPVRIVVKENLRKAQGVSVQELPIYTTAQTTTRAAELTRRLLACPVPPQLPPARYWALVAIYLSLDLLSPPHISLAARVITGGFDNTWAFVHLQACLQATLYSLRMLRQCIAVFIALGNKKYIANGEKWPTNTVDTINRLSQALESLPPIAELFTIPGQKTKSLPGDTGLLNTIKDVYIAAGIEDKNLFEEPKTKRQRQREKRKRTAAPEPEKETKRQLDQNAFAVLEDGGLP